MLANSTRDLRRDIIFNNESTLDCLGSKEEKIDQRST